MEFLEHGKEKAIVSFKNRRKLAKLEFQRTQNPTLQAPIPIWDLETRVAAHQSICRDWDLATRLENRKSAVWGRRNRRGSKSSGSALWSLREWRALFFDLNGWKKTSLGTNGMEWSTDECPDLAIWILKF
ncbi:hypothetical protein AVEN_14805-1 [Araneus ventricosus]|uniref:Uncharacterized protein n=1 Tax=Araneus ventricosus TaxID=182803 RepID=A0A4Y2FMM7_ARAVE|nr:hypothetical protein AVEN_14805-1 [Araneus ventricosus]